MSNKNPQSDGLIDRAFTWILGGIVAVFVATALTWVMGISEWVSLPFRRILSKRIDIYQVALRWPIAKWFCLPLYWLTGLALFGSFVAALALIWRIYPHPQPMTVLYEKETILFFLATLGLWVCHGLIGWLVDTARSPEGQKNLAGAQAERKVRHIIDRSIVRDVPGKTLHNALFVFNTGTDNEYSAEVDHLLITDRNIYLVETKYKSGTIVAEADAHQWTVRTASGESTMRNALKQAKNTAKQLRKHFRLPKEIVSVVAIYGNDVVLENAPSNVVPYDQLQRFISAFERQTANQATIDQQSIYSLLSNTVASDSLAKKRHIERIQQKRMNADDRQIVRSASVVTRPEGSDSSVVNEEFEASKAQHTLDSLSGMSDLKEALLEAAKEAMKSATDSGLELRANARNGILLYGDPGNGKTALVEGLAGSLNLPLIKISFGDVASKWVNSTTENVVSLFRSARSQAPCLLFLDEVDSVIKSRQNSINSDSESAKTTNQILTELVDTRGTGVIVVMATNFIDQLDPAAIREGRVDFKILVPPPDATAREAIICDVIRKSQLLYADATISRIVKRWEGFSAARIAAATLSCVRAAKPGAVREIRYEDLQRALRKTQGCLGERISEDTPFLSDLSMPKVQQQALKSVADRMIDIEIIENLGGTVPAGLLLAGPPGTGKTLAVRSLAKTTGWPLLSTTGSALIAEPELIDKLLANAKNARPCIVFIDEADDVFANRQMQPTALATVTNKLLIAIDGVKGKAHDVLWVAAVNAPEQMDPAALRGGRFTEKIWFENPDLEIVEGIIQRWRANSKAQFVQDLTNSRLALMLEGESPANIGAILQHAVNLMIDRARKNIGTCEVNTDDIAGAMAVVSMELTDTRTSNSTPSLVPN